MSDGPTSLRYRRAVLALKGSVPDDLVVRTGLEMARSGRTELVGIHVVEVDWRHDLDEEMPGSREYGATVLDIAEAQAEEVDIRLQTQLLQARDVGAALVDEAMALEADVIVLGLAYRTRRGGDFAIGETIGYVLRNAPCTVLVIRQPVPGSGPDLMEPRKD